MSETRTEAWMGYSFWLGITKEKPFKVWPENEMVHIVESHGFDVPNGSHGAFNCRVRFDDGREKECRIHITYGDVAVAENHWGFSEEFKLKGNV